MQIFAHGDESVELAAQFTPPIVGYPAIAFPLNERATVDAFNKVLEDYIGSDEMMNGWQIRLL
ncbi:hypothetical protein NKI79_31465 [Mesorhizobium sp. M0340]|uniref:hypothetical protein n=1 Tax=Mesorhizobium sp. M0340 TaxID=2956939 RepID=UPI003334F1BD